MASSTSSRSSRSSLWTSIGVLSGVCACDAYTCLDLANCASLPKDGGANVDAAPLDRGLVDAAESDVETTRFDGSDAASTGAGGSAESAASSGTNVNDSMSDPSPPSDGGTPPGSGTNEGASASVDSGTLQSGPAASSSSTNEAMSGSSSVAFEDCDEGTYWDAANAECKPWRSCEEGTYVSATGTPTTNRECTPCAVDTFSNASNADACISCKSCGWLGFDSQCTLANDAVCRTTDVTKQFGTSGDEEVRGMAVDSLGRLWVGVVTRISDYSWASLRVYSPGGASSEVFTLDGSGYSDVINGVAADSTGSIWAVGKADGVGYVKQFLPNGSEANSIAVEEIPVALTFDKDDNLWIVGRTSADLVGTNAGGTDVFARRYPYDGSAAVTYQWGGTSADSGTTVAVDDFGEAWVAGTTLGRMYATSLGYHDIFVTSFPTGQSTPFTSQFGSAGVDAANALVGDTFGNMWFGGQVSGDFEGENQAMVRKYPGDGSTPTTYQFGTDASDGITALAADAAGNVWAAGETSGDLYSDNSGSYDGFVRRFAPFGAEFTQQFGSDGAEGVTAIAVDSFGNVWVGGTTMGSLSSDSAGGTDGFIRQIAH